MASSPYARQVLCVGDKAHRRLSNAAVLVVGLGGVGAETAKNLVLSGVRAVALHDDEAAQLDDLSAQFLLTEEDVGKPRAHASVCRLAQLSVSTAVEALVGPLTQTVLSRFTAVVATRGSHSALCALNDACRAVNVPFILASTRGLFGCVFCDFGAAFAVHDARARAPATYSVESITQACPAAVLLSEDCRHALEDGDEVEFVGVDGMEELRAGGARAVTVTGAHTFLIPDDARGYGAFGGGYCRELPRKRSASFRSLREELQEPTLAHACSGGGWADEPLAPEHMHAAFRALDAFEATQGAAASASGAAVDLASSMNLPAAAAKLFQRLTQAPAADVCPVAAVLGALASAEALKAASGVFMPLQQWLYVDLSDAAPHGAQQAAEDAAAGAGASHTTPHVAAFGAAALDTLASLRLLLVGAGGIGGEALKNFALLGVGRAASGGSITVADDDVVAPANLSRGVLLRATDVGRAKAEAIAERAAALALQPSVQHVLARITSEGTSGLLSDDALSQFGVVAAAVNSFASRLALDERCVRARLAWVDAGVEGPLAHVHPVVPFASVPWSAGARDPPGREAPSCVLRNFPYLPWHTVDWARAQFDALYQAMPAEVNAYLSKRDYLEALAKKPATARLHALRALGESLVHHRPVSLQACVAWARAQFDELFRAAPQALLAAFPPGATAPDGAPFWHGTKRTPSALQFSVDDELHLGFVAAAANLHAQVYGLKGSEDAAFFRASLAALPAQDPSSTVAAPPAADADAASAEADAVAACEQALAALPSPSSLAGFRLATLQYDADDASHGDFAAAAAALRAVCYRIPAPDALVARLSAGGVPGALQPAAALAGGLLALEVCKLAAQPCPPLHAFRCRYASLASAQLLSAQPAAVCTARVVGAGGRVLDWSLWDRIDIDARGLTLADALARLQEQLGVRPSMLSHGKCLLYADFIAPAKRAERLAMGIQQLVETVGKAALPASCKHLICSVSASDEQDEDVEVPDVRFLV